VTHEGKTKTTPNFPEPREAVEDQLIPLAGADDGKSAASEGDESQREESLPESEQSTTGANKVLSVSKLPELSPQHLHEMRLAREETRRILIKTIGGGVVVAALGFLGTCYKVNSESQAAAAELRQQQETASAALAREQQQDEASHAALEQKFMHDAMWKSVENYDADRREPILNFLALGPENSQLTKWAKTELVPVQSALERASEAQVRVYKASRAARSAQIRLQVLKRRNSPESNINEARRAMEEAHAEVDAASLELRTALDAAFPSRSSSPALSIVFNIPQGGASILESLTGPSTWEVNASTCLSLGKERLCEINGLLPGGYIIRFQDVEGYSTPTIQLVQLDGRNDIVEGTYVKNR